VGFDVPSIQKGQRICDKYRETIAELLKSFVNEAVITSDSGYDNAEEDVNSFKIEQTTVLLEQDWGH
jgi:hypothetical protein